VIQPPPLPCGDDCHWKIAAIYDYWQSLWRDGKPPSRAAFDPVDIPRLLPNIWLLDVVHQEPLRFRYRLIGTHVAKARAMDRTGQFMDEEFPNFYDGRVFATLRDVVTTRLPAWRRGPTEQQHRRDAILYVERLFLPLVNAADVVDIVLALTIYFLTDTGEI